MQGNDNDQGRDMRMHLPPSFSDTEDDTHGTTSDRTEEQVCFAELFSFFFCYSGQFPRKKVRGILENEKQKIQIKV